MKTFDITFPDGHFDKMILSHSFATENKMLRNEEHCNFFGHLEKEPSSCIALTGACKSSDKMEFTINSKHSGLTNMYTLDKNGMVEAVESTFKVFLYNFQIYTEY